MTGTLVLSIIQSMAALLLAGALLYPLFSQSGLEGRERKTSFLIGVIFGVTDGVLSLSSIVLEGDVVLNASAGVLIFAGYLGGPLAASMTFLIHAGIRILYGGDLLLLALVVHFAYLLGGIALRKIAPFELWPRLPDGILPRALAAFLVMHGCGIALVLALRLVPNSDPVSSNFLLFALVGALSVAGMWFVIRESWRLAEIERENGALLQQLQLIFETCGIGAFRYNGANGKLDFDQSFLKLYGVTDEAGLNPGNFTARQVHPADREAMQRYIVDAISGDKQQDSHLFRACRADGEIHHMRSVWKLQSMTSAGRRNVIGLHMDVTDVVAAQSARTEALEHVAAVADNVPGGIYESIWENNEPRELLYISPKCAEMWGLSQEDLLADPYKMASRLHPGEFARSAEATRQAIATGEPGTARLSMTSENGEPRWIDFRVQAAKQDDGTHRVYGIFVDVTNEVAAQEEALEQAELAHRAQKHESIGQLTGGVAHDFNNILAVILGNLEVLRDEIDDEAQRKMIDAGIEASQRGAGLTRSLLSFARRARLEPEIVDLNRIVRESQNWMSRALPESVEVETSLLAGLWSVELDATSLESALLNLILNARDAMEGHGKLTIETANVRIDQSYVDSRNEEISPGRYVMLAVSDTGAGIDPESLERIFDPFFTTKPPGKGSGVGLSMVLGFVKQSSGAVQVYTEQGHGSTFKLYFPARGQDTGIAQATNAVKTRGRNAEARLLLVEDDENVRTVLLTMLENAGFNVVAAHTGDAALDVFRADPEFDLIVTDIVMPGLLQGTTLARTVRETHPDMPFIFLSGYAAEATVHGNGVKPEDIRLMKPVPKTELLNAVAEMLDRTFER